MKGLIITIYLVLAMSLMPAIVWAASNETGAGPPISQPLVREGALAVKLAEALNLGATTNEAEAEGLLAAAGIAPRNGWIADYPVTPDIVGELRSAVGDASDAHRLSGERDASIKTFDDIMAASQLQVSPDTSREAADSQETVEQDPTVINNYYYDEGPPVVTYYAPPPDYAYLYTWVPYPFWWSTYWYPGFFVLVDFDRVVISGHHRHHFSNHVFDRRGGGFFSVNPATRAHGGRFFGNDRPRTYNSSLSAGGRGAGGSFAGRTRPFVTGPARSSGSANMAPARTYQAAPWQRGTVNQPAVRQPVTTSPAPRVISAPHAMNRTYTAPSGGGMPSMHSYAPAGGGRSFTAPSAGSWSGGRSFSGGSAGLGGRSFGGGRMR